MTCSAERRTAAPTLGDLPLEVHEVLEDLVGRADDTGVGLEPALCGDHVGELGGEIDVGHLDRAGGGEADAAAVAGRADGLAAAGRAGVPAVRGAALEAGLVGERR